MELNKGVVELPVTDLERWRYSAAHYLIVETQKRIELEAMLAKKEEVIIYEQTKRRILISFFMLTLSTISLVIAYKYAQPFIDTLRSMKDILREPKGADIAFHWHRFWRSLIFDILSLIYPAWLALNIQDWWPRLANWRKAVPIIVWLSIIFFYGATFGYWVYNDVSEGQTAGLISVGAFLAWVGRHYLDLKKTKNSDQEIINLARSKKDNQSLIDKQVDMLVKLVTSSARNSDAEVKER